jgi:uncharacterized membrane protein
MRKVSNTAKWVICAVCAVLGIVALIYAVIYASTSIHSLPGFVPGKEAYVNGHYHKRAALTGVIGIVLLVIAVVVALRVGRSAATGAGSTPEPSVGPAPEGVTSEDAGDDGDAVRS